MQVGYLSQLFRSMTQEQTTILSTFKYCWDNRFSADEIMRAMEKQYLQSKKDIKMSYFYIVHQLLKKSASSNDSHFTKAISMKIKPFIAEFSKVINQEQAAAVNAMLQQWQAKKIFSAGFLAKLKNMICPSKQQKSKTMKDESKTLQPLKYNRSFVVDYMVVCGFEVTKNQYEDAHKWSTIYSQVGNLNREYQKILPLLTQPKSVNQDKIRSQIIDDLLIKSQKCKQDLINFIINLQSHLNYLIQQSQKQLKDAQWWLEEQNKDRVIDEKSTSPITKQTQKQ